LYISKVSQFVIEEYKFQWLDIEKDWSDPYSEPHKWIRIYWSIHNSCDPQVTEYLWRDFEAEKLEGEEYRWKSLDKSSVIDDLIKKAYILK